MQVYVPTGPTPLFYTSLMLGLIVYLITNRPELNTGGIARQPLWYSLRFALWWFFIFAVCVIDDDLYAAVVDGRFE